MVHGLFRASGIVMFYRLHHECSLAPQVYGISSESLGHFWRAEVGQFWKAPKFSSSTYYAKLVLPHTSPDEPDYPADVFLDQAGLDSFVPLLNDCRPELPVGESLLADALYFLSSDPPILQRAVITAAIGCEVKVKRTIRSKAPAASLKLIDLILESPRDWSLAAIALFDKGAEAALGRSLKSDNRELFKRVALLFEFRNKIAHKGERPQASTAKDAVGAAQEVFRWLDKL